MNYAEFETINKPFAARTAETLTAIAGERTRHARFLNTLSMLEHMGSYRIMVTQSSARMTQGTLKHLAEEARHAFFFKRQADRIAGRPLEYRDADMIAPAAARMYFRRLESIVAHECGKTRNGRRLIYPYVSTVIEYRAVWGYTIYQRALDAANVSISLKSLLAEESNHLSQMTAALDDPTPGRLGSFLDTEHGLFERLLGSLEIAVAERPMPIPAE